MLADLLTKPLQGHLFRAMCRADGKRWDQGRTPEPLSEPQLQTKCVTAPTFIDFVKHTASGAGIDAIELDSGLCHVEEANVKEATRTELTTTV